MTHNFKVRESPLYHIVKATVLEAQGEYEQAVSTLRAALELPSMKALARRGRGGGGGGGGGSGEAPPPASVDEPSLHDRAQAYVKVSTRVAFSLCSIADRPSLPSLLLRSSLVP